MKRFFEFVLKTSVDYDKYGKRATGVTLLELVLLIVFIAVIFLMFLGPLSRHLEKKKTLSYRMEVLYSSLCKYAESHNGQLPSADSWCDELIKVDEKISKDSFRRGDSDSINSYHISFNNNLSNIRLSDLLPNTVILFGAEGKWNLNGSEEMIVEAKSIPYLVTNGTVIICWRKGKIYKSNQSTEKKLCWEANIPKVTSKNNSN